MKMCSKCHEFEVTTTSGWCKKCKREQATEYRRKRGIKERNVDPGPDLKQCRSCRKILSLECFHNYARGFKKKDRNCKECVNKMASTEYRKQKRRELKRTPEYKAKMRIWNFERNRQIKVTQDGTVTKEFLTQLYDTQTCFYCCKDIPEKRRTADHIIPLDYGGIHSANNLAMACKSCNSSKQSSDFNFFLKKNYPIAANVLLDSLSDCNIRITTFELIYPKFIHPQILVHRAFSRNSASSRAIPILKMIEDIKNNTAEPIYWGSKNAGMQAGPELSEDFIKKARIIWYMARQRAIEAAMVFANLNVAKEIANRVLEPFYCIKVILTATDFDNFFKLRDHPAAQHEISDLARIIKGKMTKSVPNKLKAGEWHIPLLNDKNQLLEKGYTNNDLLLISAGRCARISYNTHHGVRDPKEDIRLGNQLLKDCHMSPFEHIALNMNDHRRYANFKGWKQYRSFLELSNPI